MKTRVILIFAAIIFTEVLVAVQDHKQNGKNAQQANPSSTISTNNAKSYNTEKGKNDSHWWDKFIAWPEGIATWALILTLGAIVWQSIETRRTANASERATLANLRPKLEVIAIAIIPGKIVEIDGEMRLQDDVNWRIECLIANTGATTAKVIESNLTILKLGVGTAEGLLPVFPRYGPSRNSFQSSVINPGERKMETVVLDRDKETMIFRYFRSRAERNRSTTGIPIVCFGFICYADSSEIQRRTGFIFEYHPDSMSFTRTEHPVYSYAD